MILTLGYKVVKVRRVAFIHRIADKVCSRKPPFTSSDPYALGLVERAEFPGTGRFRQGILLHGWMDIQVAETDAREEGASPGRPAHMPTIATATPGERQHIGVGI